jgi:hypothetical protein
MKRNVKRTFSCPNNLYNVRSKCPMTSPHFKQRNTPILAELKSTKNKYLLIVYNDMGKKSK